MPTDTRVRTRSTDRLIADLIDKGHLEPGLAYRIERTYAGFWQRREGAWSWYVVDGDGRERFIGSCWTVRECLRGYVVGRAGDVVPARLPDTEEGRR